jgi:hypothetical protein
MVNVNVSCKPHEQVLIQVAVIPFHFDKQEYLNRWRLINRDDLVVSLFKDDPYDMIAVIAILHGPFAGTDEVFRLLAHRSFHSKQLAASRNRHKNLQVNDFTGSRIHHREFFSGIMSSKAQSLNASRSSRVLPQARKSRMYFFTVLRGRPSRSAMAFLLTPSVQSLSKLLTLLILINLLGIDYRFYYQYE